MSLRILDHSSSVQFSMKANQNSISVNSWHSTNLIDLALALDYRHSAAKNLWGFELAIKSHLKLGRNGDFDQQTDWRRQGVPIFQILGVEPTEQQMVRVDKIVAHVWAAGGQVLRLPPLCRLVDTVGPSLSSTMGCVMIRSSTSYLNRFLVALGAHIIYSSPRESRIDKKE